MNALTEIAGVLAKKDEAITHAIMIIGDHVKPCDVGSGDDAECWVDKATPQKPYQHWYWCVEGRAGKLVEELREAFKAR
jgi:hypothetical protein